MKEKKPCELCRNLAYLYCDSDQANLCWDCDSAVHSSNFLVGKHSRNLLCYKCQEPTPWNGSGPRLARTISVCEACAISSRSELTARTTYSVGGRKDRNSNDDDDDDDDDDEAQEEDDDEEEVQIVPHGCCSASTRTTPTFEVGTSCSSSQD